VACASVAKEWLAVLQSAHIPQLSCRQAELEENRRRERTLPITTGISTCRLAKPELKIEDDIVDEVTDFVRPSPFSKISGNLSGLAATLD
jgi:hypothetical protein